MRRRVALGAASLIILLCLIHAIQDPMLVQVSDGPLGPIGIPSPFRDRNPETEGLHFLKDLGTDRCQRSLELLGLSEATRESMCAKERLYPPDHYRLQNRSDSVDQVQLIYRWAMAKSKDNSGVCVLHLRRERGRDWRVYAYDREY